MSFEKKYKADSVYQYEYVKENGVGVIYHLDSDGNRQEALSLEEGKSPSAITYDWYVTAGGSSEEE